MEAISTTPPVCGKLKFGFCSGQSHRLFWSNDLVIKLPPVREPARFRVKSHQTNPSAAPPMNTATHLARPCAGATATFGAGITAWDIFGKPPGGGVDGDVAGISPLPFTSGGGVSFGSNVTMTGALDVRCGGGRVATAG